MKIEQKMAGRVRLDANVEAVLRHCEACAQGKDTYGKPFCHIARQAVEAAIAKDPTLTIEEACANGSIPAHGVVKRIFQENPLGLALIKKGIVSPLWINSPYAGLLSPFMGYWALSKNTRNLVTTAGKAGVSSRLNGSGAAAAFTAIGQGIGTTAANAADTALETERTAAGGASAVHALATASVTASIVTTTTTNDTAQLVGTISEAATLAITESGVFNADTAGTMLCRQVFSAINVISGDSLQLTWKIKSA